MRVVVVYYTDKYRPAAEAEDVILKNWLKIFNLRVIMFVLTNITHRDISTTHNLVLIKNKT
jgi:hypothetical protein